MWSNSNEDQWLDWLNEPMAIKKRLPLLKKQCQSILQRGFSDIVLLGMGGSSLAPLVFHKTFGSAKGYPNFWVIDTLHPASIKDFLAKISLNTTLFLVASKSGSTLEPNVLYHHFLAELIKSKVKDPFAHFLAITDPISPLEQESVEKGFLPGVFGSHHIGGRYSALSNFGIFPALLMGVDVDLLLDDAIIMSKQCALAKNNPGLLLGAFLATLESFIKLAFSPNIASLGPWLEQLLAESLGKHGLGLIPIITEHEPAHLSIELKNTHELGAEMYRWQIAVAAFAHLLKINPFDQPDVEESKLEAKKLIKHQNTELKPITPNLDSTIKDFLCLIKPDHYVAILSYTYGKDSKLYHIKKLIEQKTGVPCLIQVGPRYLHSTGQLFKGGKNIGHFIILTEEYEEDIFCEYINTNIGDIHTAEALGDFIALKHNNRHVIRIHLTSVQDELDKIISILEQR